MQPADKRPSFSVVETSVYFFLSWPPIAPIHQFPYMEQITSFQDDYQAYLSILDSTMADSQVPTRSPKRPRAVILLDTSHLSLLKGSMTESDDDVSSAEYKLHGPNSPRESIFSSNSSPSQAPTDHIYTKNDDLDMFMDEMFLDFEEAEICTITDVVAYKDTSGNSHVHVVNT